MTQDQLKRIRRELGLTQKELAEELGVHPITVAKWEAEMRKIPEPTAKLIRVIRAERKRKRRKGGR